MSRRYWLPLLTAIVLILAAQQAAKAQGSQGGTTQTQRPPQAQFQPAVTPALQDNLNRIGTALEDANNKQTSADETERAKQDLAAQQLMAQAADRMFYIGLAEAIITFTGVMLVLATLLYTKRAAHAAEQAVVVTRKATADTIKAMRKATKRELRAYVHSVSGHRDSAHDPDLRFKLVFKNLGQTPAHDVILKIAGETGGDETALTAVPSRQKGRTSLGPGAEYHYKFNAVPELTLDQLSAIAGGTANYFIHGELSYSNAFGERRTTSFRYVYGRGQMRIASLDTCEHGNSAT